MLTIWFGTNDAAIPPSPQHVPISQFVANLTKMVRMVTSSSSPWYSPSTHVILMTPPPVNSYMRAAVLGSRNPPLQPDREFKVTQKYAEAVADVAEQQNVYLADVWTALYDAAGRDEQALSRFLWDGLHPNAAGYKVIYDELMKTVSEKLPELHYDNLPFVYPPWLESIAESERFQNIIVPDSGMTK